MSYPGLYPIVIARAVRSTRRCGVSWLLAVALLLAQTGLILHELNHESTTPDTYCAVCLAAQHLGSALPATSLLNPSAPPALAPADTALTRFVSRPAFAFSARAPPASS